MSDTQQAPAPVPCSDASRARDEPLDATASRVARWLLVEHRGAWGPQSVPSSRMSQNVARALAQTAAAAGARLVLVRRPHGVPSTEGGRRVFAVDSSAGAERVRERLATDDVDLVRMEWDAGDWATYDGPLYLVCTHGRHDRCCALRGRPVAKALAEAHPESTWESSHIGGDRFAPNLVVLPEGLYLGRVPAERVVQVVADLADGRLPPGLVRGRSSTPLPTQAAQAMARDELGLWGKDELVPAGQEVVEPDVWRVRLSSPEVEVVVRYDRAGDGGKHRLTCDAEEAKAFPVFRRVSLRRSSPQPP